MTKRCGLFDRMQRTFLNLVLLFFSFCNTMSRESFADENSPSKPSELVQAVIDALRSNQEKLGVLRMVLSETTIPIREDLASIPKQIETELPGGGVLTIYPVTSPEVKVTDALKGPDFFERRYYGREKNLVSVWQFYEGLWNEFKVEEKAVAVRAPGQLPRANAVDPHLLVVPGFGESLLDFLHTNAVKQVDQIENSYYGNGSVEITVEVGGGQTVKLTFGSDSRFLPVHSVVTASDGSPLLDTTLEYQLVESRDALLLKTAVRYVRVDPSVGDLKFRQMAFEGESVVSVTGYELLAGDAISKERMNWDETWKVHDLTNWEALVKAAIQLKTPQPPQNSWGWQAIAAVNAVLIALVVLWKFASSWGQKGNC